MKIEDRYDSAVIGAHPAALWFALRAIHDGRRVLLILPKDSLPKPVVSEFSGQLIDYETRGFLYNDDFQAHYLNQSRSELRWITPDERFRYSSLAQALKASDSSVKSDLHNGLTFALRSKNSPVLMPHEIEPTLESLGKSAVFNGGRSRFRADFIRQFIAMGGSVVENTEIQNVFIENNKVMGVQILGLGRMISVQHLVVASRYSNIEEKFNWSGKNKYSSAATLGHAPYGFNFTVGVTLNDEAVPPGLSDRQFYSFRDSPTVEIECATPEEYFLPDRGQKLVFLRTVLPYQSLSLDREYQRKIAQRLVKLFTEVAPFVEYNMTRILPDFRDPETAEEVELPTLYPFRDLEHIPYYLQVWAGQGLGSMNSIHGLHVVSAESFPMQGEFGADTAARNALRGLQDQFAPKISPKPVNSALQKMS